MAIDKVGTIQVVTTDFLMTNNLSRPKLNDLSRATRSYTRTYSRRLEETLGSRTPFLFILGVLAVGLVTEGFSKLVDAWLEGESLQATGWTIGAGVLVLIIVIIFYNIPQKVWMAFVDSRILQIVPHTRRAHALITLVSQGDRLTTAEGAILLHRREEGHIPEVGLRACWLIADNDWHTPASSAHNAAQLKKRYETPHFQIHIVHLTDTQNLAEVFTAAQQILKEIRQRPDLDEQETVVDFTGGNKIMSVGLVMACAESNVHLEYLEATAKTETGVALRESPFIPHRVQLLGELSLQEHRRP